MPNLSAYYVLDYNFEFKECNARLGRIMETRNIEIINVLAYTIKNNNNDQSIALLSVARIDLDITTKSISKYIIHSLSTTIFNVENDMFSKLQYVDLISISSRQIESTLRDYRLSLKSKSNNCVSKIITYWLVCLGILIINKQEVCECVCLAVNNVKLLNRSGWFYFI